MSGGLGTMPVAMSTYRLKPLFQALLRPVARWLDRRHVSANQVTWLACGVSVALGLGLCVRAQVDLAFALIPLWLLLRMALNAIDGLLAREFGHASALGGYLNELTDVVSDAALYLPLVWITPLTVLQTALFIWLAALCELAGVLGVVAGASRRYDGPAGKSDRAVVVAALALAAAVWGALPAWVGGALWLVIGLTGWTCVQRVRRGLAERSAQGAMPHRSSCEPHRIAHKEPT